MFCKRYMLRKVHHQTVKARLTELDMWTNKAVFVIDTGATKDIYVDRKASSPCEHFYRVKTKGATTKKKKCLKIKILKAVF